MPLYYAGRTNMRQFSGVITVPLAELTEQSQRYHLSAKGVRVATQEKRYGS